MRNEAFREKVSVNINSDFINQALRGALQQRQSTIDRITDQNTSKQGDPWFIGIYGITKKDIAEHFEAGETFSTRGYGVLIIDADCPEEQLFAVVQDIRVKGKVSCAKAVREHYGLKCTYSKSTIRTDGAFHGFAEKNIISSPFSQNA